MSTKNVQEEIKKFLKSKEPEVLCVRGKWGTGKTYNWKAIAKTAKDEKFGIGFGTYAYVSLFGVTSITDVKMQIVLSTHATSSIGEELTSGSWTVLWDNMEQKVKGTVAWAVSALGKNQFEAAMAAMAVTINKQIICIDDIERKGMGLSTADILGLVSYFKEERDCKVAILLNDEVLEGPDKKAFSAYLEKVVDINLLFAPTPAKSAKVALEKMNGPQKLKDLVSERVTTLGIDNVRVIRKIFRLVVMIANQLEGYALEVLKNVVSSLVLFGWSHYQPELAPPTNFLCDSRSEWATFKDKEKQTDDERKWGILLDTYGFVYTDEFDLVLMKGVADGYFQNEAVAEHAAELQKRDEASAAQNELRAAWEHYHYSFKNTVQDVQHVLYSAFMKNIEFYKIGDAASLINLFRELGDTNRAQAILDAFLTTKKDDSDAFNIDHLYRRGEDLPDDVKEAFAKAQQAQKPDFSVDDALMRLKSEGFNDEVTSGLANAPTKEYFRVFMTYEGRDKLGEILYGVSQYLRVHGINNYAKAIMDRSGEALRIIAKTSPLNHKRTHHWGLIQRLDDSEVQEHAAAASGAPLVSSASVERVTNSTSRKRSSKPENIADTKNSGE